MKRMISLLMAAALLLGLAACGQEKQPAGSAEVPGAAESAARITVELTPEQEQARQAAMGLTFTAVNDGEYFTALRSDGRVIALPSFSEEVYLADFEKEWTEGMYQGSGMSREEALQNYRQNLCHVQVANRAFHWEEIIDICSNGDSVFGLDAQGRVHMAGPGIWAYEDVEDWTGIVSLAGCGDLLLGVDAEGSVKVAGQEFYNFYAVQDWSDVQWADTNGNSCLGLTEAGSLLLTGSLADNVNMSLLAGTEAYALGYAHILGLRPDGTVAAAPYAFLDRMKLNAGQCEVGGWTDIVAVDAGRLISVGLRADGTVVACGDLDADMLSQIAELKDVASIRVSSTQAGDTISGMRTDGSFFALSQDGTGADNQRAMDWLDVYAVSAGERHFLGLKTDGTVIALGDNDLGQCEVSQWSDLVQVAAGNDYSLGLRSDGTVVATGDNQYGACQVDGWEGVIQIGAGQSSVGLKANGEVLNAGWSNVRLEDFSQKEIVAVAAGYQSSYGICRDGSVVFAGDQLYQYSPDWQWQDVVKLETEQCGFALKSDGTVVMPPVEYLTLDPSSLTDIRDFSASSAGILGVKNDGTVVAVWNTIGTPWQTYDVSGWQDIVDVQMQPHYALGLRSDGTVAAAGDADGIYGVCEVEGWTGIVDIATGFSNSYGLRSDGTVVTAGNHMQQYNVPNASQYFVDQLTTWTDVTDLECSNLGLFGVKADGTVCYLPEDTEIDVSEVEAWTDIVQLSAGDSHVLGLKSDGTVVAAGDNSALQCQVNGW